MPRVLLIKIKAKGQFFQERKTKIKVHLISLMDPECKIIQ